LWIPGGDKNDAAGRVPESRPPVESGTWVRMNAKGRSADAAALLI